MSGSELSDSKAQKAVKDQCFLIERL